MFEGQYLTYEEYVKFGGSIEQQSPFDLLEFEARQDINARTFGRLEGLENYDMKIKMCVFSLINLYQSINNGIDINGNVVNYDNKEIRKQVKNIIYKYLSNLATEDGTPLLYCGVE